MTSYCATVSVYSLALCVSASLPVFCVFITCFMANYDGGDDDDDDEGETGR